MFMKKSSEHYLCNAFLKSAFWIFGEKLGAVLPSYAAVGVNCLLVTELGVSNMSVPFVAFLITLSYK